MKVLMIEHFLPGSIYSLELSRELCKHVDLTLYTSRNYRAEHEDFKCKTVLEDNIKSSKLGILYYFIGVLHTAMGCLFGKYDIVHIQTFKKMQFEVPIYSLMKKTTTKKLVYTAHNILPHENDPQEAKRLKEWYKLCDCIIVHNEQSKKILCNFADGVESKVRVIPHGIYNLYKNAVKEEKHDKKVFLEFGMIRKYKGIALLIQAVSLLPEDIRSQIKVVIAGKQYKELDDTDYEAMIKKYGVGGCVQFISRHIPDDEVPALFNQSDFCVFPYEDIYGSGALLMAYTFEKPVIVSDIPAFIEETDNLRTGIAFENSNAEQLANAIKKFAAISEKEVHEYKHAIIHEKENKYNWGTSAKSLVEVYGGCLKGCLKG